MKQIIKLSYTKTAYAIMDIGKDESYEHIMDRIHAHIESHGGAEKAIRGNESIGYCRSGLYRAGRDEKRYLTIK